MNSIISQILSRCNDSSTNIAPTILYNEGWMTRLLVECSIREKINISGINFSIISNWYSEGLLSSPFLAQRRGDKLAEGYTHTDIALGDFNVTRERGDITVDANQSIFGVIEAKMGSPLSAGTTNAPNYNQASRNLACIAFNTKATKLSTFFFVAAPSKKIIEHNIKTHIRHPFTRISEVLLAYTDNRGR